MIDALSKANAAVVGIQVTAVPDARSIQTLGRERTGSGVVIGADGLVLTIGYLMLEAQRIEVVTQDNKSLPATAVAYDIATGFGLVRPLLPLRGVAPVTLGNSQDVTPGEALMAATGATVDGEDGDVSMTQLVSKRFFGQLGVPHRHRAVHQPTRHCRRGQPQRRAAVQPDGRTGRHRLAAGDGRQRRKPPPARQHVRAHRSAQAHPG
ncbi:serine protease [Polaromonas sp. P1(28)-8]|nr:serine protease [Polaromonas sp. P1(28)-8]